MAMSKNRETKNLIVGLDIGTSKIVAIVGEIKPEGTLEVIGVGMHESSGMKKGMVVNIDAAVGAIQRALGDAELMADCKIREVYTGIAGSHIKSSNANGMVKIKDKEVIAGRHRPRDRNRQFDQPAQRPADPAYPGAGVQHRRAGRYQETARHERHEAGSGSAYRYRCGGGGAEHHEVRTPLRAGSERDDFAAAGIKQGRAGRRREGFGRVPGGYRRRHHRCGDFYRRRDPPHRRDSHRGRPDHQRHRDGLAHPDQGRGRHQDQIRLRACASWPTMLPSKCPAWANAERARCRARLWRK